MLSSLLVAASMLSALGGGESPPKPDLAAYEAARAGVGRDADAHVKLALWCEAHGLSAERLKHLTMATLLDPKNTAARGLLGLVAYGGKWLRPDDVEAYQDGSPASQAAMREYLERRAASRETAEAQAKLAAWCERSGLKEQAQAHYQAVLRQDPSRESIWKKLGYRKNGGRWLKPEQIAAEKAESDRQHLANKYWKTQLERLRERLVNKDADIRIKAQQSLSEITDPRAVPMVWDVLVSRGEVAQLAAVQILGQIDGAAASKAVAAIGLFSPYPPVRGRALEITQRRDPRDLLDSLISMIRAPLRYEVLPINGPGSTGGLFVEGELFNVRKIYEIGQLTQRQIPDRIFTSDVPFDPFSTPNALLAAGWTVGTPGFQSSNPQQMSKVFASARGDVAKLIRQQASPLASDSSSILLATQMFAIQRDQRIAIGLGELQQQLRQAQQSLEQDIQSVEVINAGIRDLNDRVLPIVRSMTGKDFGANRDNWSEWWSNELGYAYRSSQPVEKPTYTEVVFVPTAPPVSRSSSCFSAGTLVHSVDGPHAIETLQIGDRVLAQDTSTGALSFQPIVAVHHNQPTATLKLRIGGETIVATGIHRFWKAGKGWVMARELKPGDVVRAVGGTAKVESAETGPVQPVYNLDVARCRNFFVGTRGLLVYDFSRVAPVPNPFDGLSEIASVAAPEGN